MTADHPPPLPPLRPSAAHAELLARDEDADPAPFGGWAGEALTAGPPPAPPPAAEGLVIPPPPWAVGGDPALELEAAALAGRAPLPADDRNPYPPAPPAASATPRLDTVRAWARWDSAP